MPTFLGYAGTVPASAYADSRGWVCICLLQYASDTTAAPKFAMRVGLDRQAGEKYRKAVQPWKPLVGATHSARSSASGCSASTRSATVLATAQNRDAKQQAPASPQPSKKDDSHKHRDRVHAAGASLHPGHESHADDQRQSPHHRNRIAAPEKLPECTNIARPTQAAVTTVPAYGMKWRRRRIRPTSRHWADPVSPARPTWPARSARSRPAASPCTPGSACRSRSTLRP